MRWIPVAIMGAAALVSAAETDQQRQQLIGYLNAIGASQAQARAHEVAQIRTRFEAERRRAQVREKILTLIGGLPDVHGPVSVRQFGKFDGDGFHVEKIAYESMPGMFVTADVYVPAAGAAPFSAVVLTPGHEPTGKLGQYAWGANLARRGILALAIDPLGQGERLQHFDPELGASKVGGATGEHGHAGIGPMLIGDHVARYFVADGMRGIDYLTSRKDVDAQHIGAFGCSGGGTATAYLAALDGRVKVAAVACYITSFDELLPTAGPQEAEQSIPRFLEQGLDFGDWVELAAPKPYAIVSTTNDMFPFAGARKTYEEAKRIYGLYGAQDQLQWITGPGGHGALAPISPAILAFLVRWLKNDSQPPSFEQLRPKRRDDLICTPTGQLSTSGGSDTVESINRKRAAALVAGKHALANTADLERFQVRLREQIRATAAVVALPGSPPPAVTIVKSERRETYRVETIALASEPGIELAGLVAIPEQAGPKPAVLLMDSQPKETVAPADFDRLAKSGHVVFILQPRGTPGADDHIQSPLLGVSNLLSLRALVVGKTIVGMRIDDTIRSVDWLYSRPDVKRSAITAYGNGALGVALLHAAALDARIGRVVVENTLASYRMAVDQPLHRNIPEIALPGVLRHYDLGDLMLAAYPRSVAALNPVDAVGVPLREQNFRKELDYVFESDRNLGSPDRVRLLSRGFREPLPID
jgi:cephalosporin-C deacetylase-like acetyl esterase